MQRVRVRRYVQVSFAMWTNCRVGKAAKRDFAVSADGPTQAHKFLGGRVVVLLDARLNRGFVVAGSFLQLADALVHHHKDFHRRSVLLTTPSVVTTVLDYPKSGKWSTSKIPYVGLPPEENAVVAQRLAKQLGAFLRKKRGNLTYQQFSRKLGISDSTLQRLEMGEQNVTLKTLEYISDRFHCKISELFGEER
jgi:DNA-binding Xre family transcriptional regulator